MRCDITLKPHMPAGQVESMDVALVLTDLLRTAGEELFRAQVETVTIPGCVPENVRITDDAGTVPFTQTDSTPYPYHFLHYAVQRDHMEVHI